MRALPFVVAAAVAIACAPRGKDVRLARLAAERRALDATLDGLEERLLATQSRVRFWQEMRARHEGVSAISCASLDEHAGEMASRALPPPPRPALRSARVAAAAPARPPGRAPAASRARD